MAKIQFHGNITGDANAKATFDAMFHQFLNKGNANNMHVYVDSFEQDGEVAVDASFIPAGTTVPDQPIIFAYITNDEDEMKFFTENNGEVLKVKHLKYLPNEGAVEVTL